MTDTMYTALKTTEMRIHHNLGVFRADLHKHIGAVATPLLNSSMSVYLSYTLVALVPAKLVCAAVARVLATGRVD